jgi:hypothetical protein
MSYPVKLVVRYKNCQFYGGHANSLALNNGWRTVEECGKWYGIQMVYKPYKATLNYVSERADELNKDLFAHWNYFL